MNEAFKLRLGARVRDRRKAAGLTLDALAGAAGMSKAGVWQVEAGLSMPEAWTLYRLSVALGVSADWLLTGRERAAAQS
jgi:transcriptional regulator with XRE-family HTH domain